MSQSIYNPLNLNNPVPVDFDDLSDHEPFTHCFGEIHPMYSKKHTPEMKKNMSKLMSGKGNPRYGVTVSEETKKKISKAKMGKSFSPETKKKISKAMKGKKNALKTLNQ